VKSFELLEPATMDEAIALLEPDNPSVRVVAGATALVPMMKARLFQPTRLISLRRIGQALRGVRPDANVVRIGALTTLSELEQSAHLREKAPVISRALRTLSNVRIRNVATLGGHLAHGDPHMDLPPILMTLGARVRLVGRKGERWLDIADLILGYYQTAVGGDDLIAEVELTSTRPDVRTWYEKFTALSADDWPTVGAAVWLRVNADRVVEARVAVSAATDRPVRVQAAEAVLNGAPASGETFGRAADAAAKSVDPLADIRGSAAYKREMVRVHVRRALEKAR
jgi:carbon-monoxide dehydrogenase medium subunit